MRRPAVFFVSFLAIVLPISGLGRVAVARVARPLEAVAATPLSSRSVGSDFNGDGFPDLAIGVPHDDTENANDAGAVNVLYGSSVGLEVNSPPDQRWTQDSVNVKGTSEPGDQLGAALAAGDFNGDGFGDLAVGVPGDSCSGQEDAGVVNVLYGSASGLEAETPIDDQLWTQDSTSVLDSCETGDAFGSALAIGDFNDDLFVDLAIGLPSEDVGTVSNAGAVSILYGSAAGLQADAPDDQFLNQDSPGVQGEAQKGDKFASSLTVGDFNGDGFADLAAGIPSEAVSGHNSAGATAVLYGTAAGVQADSPDDQLWNRDSPGVTAVAEAFDKFGGALASGEFNGDGFSDLAVGVSRDDVDSNSIVDAGSVSVLYGTSSGLQATTPDDQFWSQNSSNVQGTSKKNDHFGDAVAAGDFNGDGFADLAVGIPDKDVGSAADAGSATVLYGASGGLQASDPNDQLWSQDTADVKGVAEPSDQLGSALAAGDFDLDGFADLALGVPGEPGANVSRGGAVAVLYGSSDRLQAVSPDDDRWTQDTIGVEGEMADGDEFGSAVAASS